jgi:hypothetical protein
MGKSKLLFLSVLSLILILNNISAQKSMGEPVPGAEIYIELEPDDEPIANTTTDENGEFYFMSEVELPKTGTFVLTLKFPKKLSLLYKLDLKKATKIKVPFNKMKDGPKFSYVLYWIKPTKAQNKGAFAVSGKNST